MRVLSSDAIRRTALLATGTFAVASLLAVVSPSRFTGAVAVVDAALFVAGCVLFFLGYGRALSRSRTDAIGIGGLFFLAGVTAPTPVRRTLLGSLVAQVLVALGAAAARPYSLLAASALVPIFGLGLCGYWAAHYGRFGLRVDE